MSQEKAYQEVNVSVDYETTGPVPGLHAAHQIGACVVGRTEIRFKRDIIVPEDVAVECDALTATGYTLEDIRAKGRPLQTVMNDFTYWVAAIVPELAGVPHDAYRPVFVGLNVAFDWMFYRYDQVRCRVSNPFGHAARDIKTMIADYTGCSWHDAKKSKLPAHLRPTITGRLHDAEYDALEQAEIFQNLTRAFAERRAAGNGGL